MHFIDILRKFVIYCNVIVCYGLNTCISIFSGDDNLKRSNNCPFAVWKKSDQTKIEWNDRKIKSIVERFLFSLKEKYYFIIFWQHLSSQSEIESKWNLLDAHFLLLSLLCGFTFLLYYEVLVEFIGVRVTNSFSKLWAQYGLLDCRWEGLN